MHQTIGNIIQTFELNESELEESNPFAGILAATMFATRATYHTTLQATPTQLVFRRDAILNTQFKANWKYIKERKQKLIEQNNRRKNKKQVAHEYHAQDLVLYRIPVKRKYGEADGPDRIC